MKFTLNGVWNTGSTSFGPTATGYFSMGYAGTVGGAGSNAQVKINLTFKDNLGNNLRSAISFTDTITTAGSFAKTYTSSIPMTGGSVGANKQVRVNGTIEFLAQNGGGPVDLSPVNLDCGGAPPTATWVAGNGDFNDPANWNGTGPDFIVEPGSTFPTVPNNPGDRARIVNLGLTPGGTRTINITNATTLGTLDIDDDDAVNFMPSGPGVLNFDSAVGGADAVIRTGNSQGSASTEINVPINLGKPMTVAVDSASTLTGRGMGTPPGLPNVHPGQLNLNSQISGAQSITTVADGTVGLNGSAPNTFTGGLHSRAGIVEANKLAALGTGTATVQDSSMIYNVSGASNPTTVTEVTGLGQYSVGAPNISSEDRVSIGDLAAVEANAIILGQYQTLDAIGRNLTLATGAMIAHRTFDPGASGNPQGIDPTNPLYIFGVSQFFGNSAINVGSDSNSPWKGFGGPRGHFQFGDGGNGQLGIAGAAELVSLRGTMVIASQLVAVGPTSPSITIRGGGHVIVDSPPIPFAGPVTVESGSFSITSGWTPQSITVMNGGAMGGPGSNAPLILFDGAHIAPGDNGGFQSIGTFQAFSSLALSNGTLWDFDLDVPGVVGGPNDLLVVDGPVILDGILNVNGLENFGPGTYTIALLNGAITDNVVELGILPPNYDYGLSLVQNFAGNSSSLLLHVSEVPEPASIGLLAAAGLVLGRRTRRR